MLKSATALNHANERNDAALGDCFAAIHDIATEDDDVDFSLSSKRLDALESELLTIERDANGMYADSDSRILGAMFVARQKIKILRDIARLHRLCRMYTDADPLDELRSLGLVPRQPLSYRRLAL